MISTDTYIAKYDMRAVIPTDTHFCVLRHRDIIHGDSEFICLLVVKTVLEYRVRGLDFLELV